MRTGRAIHMAAAVVLGCLVGSPLATAKPGPLSDKPLFIGTKVKPNVMLVIDDSRSMNWELLWSKEAVAAHDLEYDEWRANTLDFTPAWYNNRAKRELCAGYNTLAYDPTRTYGPWKGRDADNAPFTDQSLSAARTNPFDTSVTVDLSDHYYYQWNDDGDGVYQNGECATGNDNRVFVSSLPAAQQVNYANWYSYYRKRDLVMKRAVTELASANKNLRLGLATLHNINDVATEIHDNEDDAHRAALLRQVTRIEPGNPSGGTPLRTTLNKVGRYFDANDGADTDLGLSGGQSPILPRSEGGACQQNFALLLSDGYWNGDSPGVGNVDGGNNAYAGGSFADTYSNTLADVAMRYYATDLDVTLANEVPTLEGIDENPAQHLVTFTVGFGVPGSLDHDPPNREDAFEWPEPESNEPTTSDDMRHAAWNGRGKYLNAGSPAELIKGLEDAISAIVDRTGSGGSVSFSSAVLDTDTAVYQGLFNTNGWSGDLRAYRVDPDSGRLAAAPEWKAADKLDADDVTADSRSIVTFDGHQGTPFRWSSLTPAQRNDLRTNPAGATDPDPVAKGRLDFIRGDRTHEGSGHNFRARKSRLGDIIGSSPTYVGAPKAAFWSDAPPFPTGTRRYSKFVEARAGRSGMIYVGANDGMLHGFDENGNELLAYIPSTVFSTETREGLHFLSDPRYAHRYHVDLTPVVAPAHIESRADATAGWRTVLIGGQGAGGRGLFALDVTDPGNFSEDSAAELVLWEFTAGDDADLGYTFSEPTIGLLNNGKWAAIFGNGYNNTGTGEASLFIAYLEGGLDGSWTEGEDYIKLSTGVGDPGERNGLASPEVVDVDGNGTADRVYAGDLHGNLWAFDIAASADLDWQVAADADSLERPLFSAQDTQPITSRPAVIRHPSIPNGQAGGSPNFLVMFGTGQYLTEADRTNTDLQAFYGVWDIGMLGLSKDNLQQQTLEYQDDKGRVPSDHPVNWLGTGDHKQYGWYLELTDAGERVDTHPVVRDDIVYFNTKVPADGLCSGGGTGWIMSLDINTGGRPNRPVFDYDGNDTIDLGDTKNLDGENAAYGGQKSGVGLPGGVGIAGDVQMAGGSDSDRPERRKLEELSGADLGRISWLEFY